MSDSSPESTPLNPSMDLNNEASRKLTRELHAKFRTIISQLAFLTDGTRLDI
jgi:hypothetical protein